MLNPLVQIAPYSLHIEDFPTETTLLPAYEISRIWKTGFWVCFAFPATLVISGFLTSDVGLQVISLFLLLIVAGIAYLKREHSRSEWRVVWHESHVRVLDRRWSRNLVWEQPYDAFEGLELQKRSVSLGGESHRQRDYYVVELVHPNSVLSVLCHASNTLEEARIAHSHALTVLSVHERPRDRTSLHERIA